MCWVHYSHEIRGPSRRLQRHAFAFKLLSHNRNKGRRSIQERDSCVLVMEDWGCWRSLAKEWARLGQPVLIRYSSHEWSRVVVILVDRLRGPLIIF